MLELHLVSHTHWDREWYHPAGVFRQRLVALVDELLDDPPPLGSSFLLDGQAIVLEDYLAVRPDRAAELGALLRAGRLEAGPWYVLADELIPGGEALVRNLLAGRRVLRAMRAEAPPVLYCPDSFGHPAALPLIAAGFGLPLVVLWRGYGGARWPAGDAARWQGPDTTIVQLHHLPPDGYEVGSDLPTSAEAVAARWQSFRDALVSRATRGVSLLLNGADHHARQLGLTEAIDALRSAAGDDARIVRSSLRAFAEAVVATTSSSLPVVSGELRDSYGYTWALQGTFASRAAQKRRNALAERMLLREAEPWAAVARLHGAPSRRALVDATWRELLACQPHDTLCGCSIDAVARAMDARLEAVLDEGEALRRAAVLDLAGHGAAAARTARDRWSPVLIVRNAAARRRSGVATVRWEEFLADVPVGPASAGAATELPVHVPVPPLLAAAQPLDERSCVSLTESPRHYPDADLVRETSAVIWVDGIDGYSLRTFGADTEASLPDSVEPVQVIGTTASNGLLRLSLSETGAVTFEDLTLGAHIESMLSIEDRSDAGDLYTPAPRGRAFDVQFTGTRILHAGPLRASIVTSWNVTHDRGELPLAIAFILDAGARFLRIRVAGENRATDHRLRLLLQTGVPSAGHWADAAFGPVRREPLDVPPQDRMREIPPPTNPLHRYVSRFGDAHGATVYSDGLAEYEAMEDGAVALTLLRAVGELSRNDLPERPGHAGWPAPVPAAQVPGPFQAEFALLLHAATRSDAVIDEIERTADDVLLPLTGEPLRSAIAPVPARQGITLAGEGLAFSTIRESDDGTAIVLRCVNLLDRATTGHWDLGASIAAAHLSRLDETILAELRIEGSSIPFEAAPRAVVTILATLLREDSR